MNNRTCDDLVAKKYAQAFMNIHLDQLTLDDCCAFEKARQFLQTHHKALFFLQIPQFTSATKKAMVDDIITRFIMPQSIASLLLLLITHGRSFYIPRVLFFVIQLYKKHHAIVDFSVVSSHALDESKALCIKKFLKHITGKQVVCTYSVNNYLIAGVRMRSDEYMWEYSVRKHIDCLRVLAN